MWPWSNDAPQNPAATVEAEPPTPSTKYSRDPESIKARVDASIAHFPDTMSCQQAFDLALTCSNPVGQLRSGYRYGSWRNCSQHWGDFWFCMRQRVYSEEQKRERIKEYYREREQRILAGPNSQDVWEERDKPAKQEEFFTGDVKDIKGW